jgi:hypothetical protein
MGTTSSRLSIKKKKSQAQVQDETNSNAPETAFEKPPFPANNFQNEDIRDLDLAVRMGIPLPASPSQSPSSITHSLHASNSIHSKSSDKLPAHPSENLPKKSILDTKLPPLTGIINQSSETWPDMHADEGPADEGFQAQLEADLEQSLNLSQSLLPSNSSDEVNTFLKIFKSTCPQNSISCLFLDFGIEKPSRGPEA